MTQVQRKTSPRQQQIELAPNQIYIKRPGCSDPIQTVIEGCPDWSYVERVYLQKVALFYQGRYVLSLAQKAGSYETVSYGPSEEPPVCYVSLADAAQSYAREHETYLCYLAQFNREEGLEEWCLRQSFATANITLRLTFPQSVRQRLQRVVESSLYGGGLEEMVARAIYASLPELEQQYCPISATTTEAEA